ncbi:MAG: PIG-L family deacetylase [Planctomycetota bacterium]
MNNAAPQRTILLFAPHPDDETLGCGGYVAQRIDAGDRVIIVVLTMGEKLFSHCLQIYSDPSPEQIRDMRREESQRATAILGVAATDVVFWEYADLSIADNAVEITARIAALLREFKAVEVLCTGPDEEHPDHRAACSVVQRACAQAAPGIALRWYITALRAGLTIDRLPLTVHPIDITKQLARKAQAVAQFRAHLDIVSKQQAAPIVADFKQYLTGQEILLA